MPENAFAEQIVPGTYVRVLAEGLISVGGISAGNIGIVGTANPNQRRCEHIDRTRINHGSSSSSTRPNS